jgi:glyoxylase-like metal-dependent hydrolase (beta-lactamase superfamily II)
MRKPEKVIEGVYVVGSGDISHAHDCMVYLVDAGELVLIDSGAGSSFDRLVANIESLGFSPEKLDSLIVTHCHIDHVGSLARFKEAFGVTIISHEAEAGAIETGDGVLAELYGVEYRPVKVDRILRGEEDTVRLGRLEMKALHIPGHTAGSMALVLDAASGERVLFGQDIHGPYNPAWGADRRLARSSLRKLMDVGADILCEGHFGIIRPAASVKKFIGQFLSDLEF